MRTIILVVEYNTSHSSSTHDIRHDQRQLVHGTLVQLLRAQAEAVAYKSTLARPSARKYSVRRRGRTMRWMCESSLGVIDELLVLLVL